MKPSTRLHRQRGQVMVIVALMMVVMVGAVGLGVDGGRAYVERRVEQNAADAAALAAADKYWADIEFNSGNNTSGVNEAFTAAVNEFSYEENLSSSGWSTSFNGAGASACQKGAATTTATYTQGSTTLVMSAIPAAQATTIQSQVPTGSAGLCIFNANATDSIPAFFINVLNGIGSLPIGVTASALSGHRDLIPTLLVLNTDCSASAADWKADGASTTTIVGTAWSDGNIQDTQNGTNVTVTGQVYDRCDATVPSPQITATQGTFGHATYNPDPLAGSKWVTLNSGNGFEHGCTSGASGVAGTTGTWVSSTSTCNMTGSATDANKIGNVNGGETDVELKPGQYSQAAQLTGSGCWFMAPGIYEWNSGTHQGDFQMTAHGQVISNELVPPGAQDASTNLYPSVDGNPADNKETPQFDWNDSEMSCRGGLGLYSFTCLGVAINGCAIDSGVAPGTYYFRVTAARQEASGTWRESYMSNNTPNGVNLPAGFTSLPVATGCVGPVVVAGVGTTSATQLQIGISNVPGMGNPGDTTEYHVYAAKNPADACGTDTHFGYVTSATFSHPSPLPKQTEVSLSCPNIANPGATQPAENTELTNATCTLNDVWSTKLTSSNLGSTWSVQSGATGYCSVLSHNWSSDVGCVPNYLQTTSSQDTANEDYCVASGAMCKATNTLPATGNPVTPGGVMFYFPSTSFNVQQTNGGPYIYGNLGLRSVVLYAQAGGADATINGADKSNTAGTQICKSEGVADGNALCDAQFIGQVYMPTEQLNIQGGGAPIDGAIIVWELNTEGGAKTLLTGRFPAVLVTTPGHLITCTTTTPATSYCPNP